MRVRAAASIPFLDGANLTATDFWQVDFGKEEEIQYAVIVFGATTDIFETYDIQVGAIDLSNNVIAAKRTTELNNIQCISFCQESADRAIQMRNSRLLTDAFMKAEDVCTAVRAAGIQIRPSATGDGYVELSQIQVFNKAGTNVVLNKAPMATSEFVGGTTYKVGAQATVKYHYFYRFFTYSMKRKAA